MFFKGKKVFHKKTTLEANQRIFIYFCKLNEFTHKKIRQ